MLALPPGLADRRAQPIPAGGTPTNGGCSAWVRWVLGFEALDAKRLLLEVELARLELGRLLERLDALLRLLELPTAA